MKWFTIFVLIENTCHCFFYIWDLKLIRYVSWNRVIYYNKNIVSCYKTCYKRVCYNSRNGNPIGRTIYSAFKRAIFN